MFERRRAVRSIVRTQRSAANILDPAPVEIGDGDTMVSAVANVEPIGCFVRQDFAGKLKRAGMQAFALKIKTNRRRIQQTALFVVRQRLFDEAIQHLERDFTAVNRD